MEPVPQHEPASEHAAHYKIQRAPCAKLPTPPPSPDSYTGDDFADYDASSDEIGKVPTKWEHSDDDSYGSLCPKDKKYSCKRPPSIKEEEKFLQYFSKTPNTVPVWAMLEIRVDLRTEYGILTSARRTANLRRKAKQSQHCFVNRDVTRQTDLERVIPMWESKPCAKKIKG